MQRATKWCLPAFLTTLLCGCGWLTGEDGLLSDNSGEYAEAKEGKDLVVPDDLDQTEIGDPWPIPEIPDPVRLVLYPDKAPRPDALYASEANQEVKIQRIGDRRWLVLPEPPSMVWPKVKQFMADNGVAVVSEQPPSGRLNTEWLTISDESYRDVIRLLLRDARAENDVDAGRDRMLVRIEQGIRPQTSEVHVRHENDSLHLPVDDDFDHLNDIDSSLGAAETAMLSELGSYIAAKVSEASISMVAQEIATQTKTRLDRDADGDPVLLMFLDFERAWATVGQALDNADVDVTEVDEDRGDFRISLQESEFTGEKKGFFGRMFGGKDIHNLRLHVSPNDSGVGVTVTSEGKQALNEDLSQQVLLLIREFAT